jgi:hypothetical protein
MMDEETPPSESELQPLWQMGHNDCKDTDILTGGGLINDNKQKEILTAGNATSSRDNNPPERKQGVSHLFLSFITVLFIHVMSHSFCFEHNCRKLIKAKRESMGGTDHCQEKERMVTQKLFFLMHPSHSSFAMQVILLQYQYHLLSHHKK